MSRPLRILLVGNYAPDRQHSMLRYADWLDSGLQRNGWIVKLVTPPLRLARLARGNPTAQKWLGFIDKFILFTIDLRRLAAFYDVIHLCDHSHTPYLWALKGRRVSVTCHDLISIKILSGEVPGQRLSGTGKWLQSMIRAGLRRARHPVFISETTRSDFSRLIRPAPPTSEVIHNPVIGFGGMTLERATLLLKESGLPIDRPFLLHIGNNLWYKNRVGAIRLFGLLRRARPDFADARMICVGPALPGSSLQEAHDWRENLTVVSEASNELIEALYTRAQALLFPSLDEGFGWPIIEAQACGCPVVTSDRDPMRSLAGPAALLIDPADLDTAALIVVKRWDWLMTQRQAARAHAATFSEAAAAKRYSDAFATIARLPPNTIAEDTP